MKVYLRKSHTLRKLAFCIALLMLIMNVIPSINAVAYAALKPTFEKDYIYSYMGKSDTFKIINLKRGYTIQWSISEEAAGYVSFSKSDKTQNTKTTSVTDATSTVQVYTSNSAYKKVGTSYKVSAVIINNKGKKIATCSDSVMISVDAYYVGIKNEPKNSTMYVNETFDFNRRIAPTKSSNKTFWIITDEKNKVLVNTKTGIKSYRVSMTPSGKFTPKSTGTYNIIAVVYRSKTASVLRAESSPVAIKVLPAATVTPKPTVTPTPVVSPGTSGPTTPTVPDPLKFLTVDLSKFRYNEEEDTYYLSSKIVSLNGTIDLTNVKVKQFDFEIRDDKNFVIQSGTVKTANPWIIENPGLTLGLNNITITAEDVSGKKYIKKFKLNNFDESYLINLDVDTEDDDSDGLNNYLEDYYGTDKSKADSDGDGLTDDQELLIFSTDPLKADSDGNEISDGNEDFDEDDVNNLEELSHNGNPFMIDTDMDGLTDVVEISKGTMLDNADSDGDGISDADELALGLNPLSRMSDGITEDSLRTFIQDLSTSRIGASLQSGENITPPDVFGDVAGFLDSNVSLEESKNDVLHENRAIIGLPVEIISKYEVPSLTLSFDITELKNTYGEDYVKQLMICSFLDNKFVPLDTITDLDKNLLLTNQVGAGTFFVVNVDEFLSSLGIIVDSEIETPEPAIYSLGIETGNSEELDSNVLDANLLDSMEANPSESDRANEVPAGWYEENKIKEPEAGILPEADTLMRSTFMSTAGETRGQADIVFIIDSTGSMSGTINNVKNNIINFVDRLNTEYNVQVNFALVDYKDILADGLNSTVVIKNGLSNWFSNSSDYKQKINNLYVDGGGDGPETAIDSLERARLLDFRNSVNKFAILVTDADYKVANRYEISSMEEMVDRLVASNINVSVISDTDYIGIYSDLYTSTKGIFADIYGDFSDELMKLADMIGEVTSDGSWVLLEDYQYIKLLEEPSATSNTDTDGDGVSDFNELGSLYSIDLTKYIQFTLADKGVPYEYYKGKTAVEVYDYVSNPILRDTDFDGLEDSADSAPLKWDVCNRDLAMFAALAYEEGVSYNTKSIKGTVDEPGERYYFLDFASAAEVMDYWTLVDYTVEWADIDTHFSASTYKNGNNIIIAYRGTDGEIGEWVNNVISGAINYHSEEGNAKAYALKMADRYSNYNIYITGHSLGGYLAQFGAAQILENRPLVKLQQVSYFNGIGLKFNKLLFWTKNKTIDTLKEYSQDGTNIKLISYYINGDLVSAIGTHSGKEIGFAPTQEAVNNHKGRYGSTEVTWKWRYLIPVYGPITQTGDMIGAGVNTAKEYLWITHETDSFFYYLKQGTR